MLGAALLLAPGVARAQDDSEVRIGVLAHRGWDGAEEDWSGLAAWITQALGGRPVRMVPLTLGSTGPHVEAGGIQFLVTNPGHYVALSDRYPMSVLATRKRRLVDGSLSAEFGSAILVRADGGVTTLAQLPGLRIGAVAPDAFGGYRMAWFEAASQGIDLDRAELRFYGFPQDRIVQAVLDGEVEAGIVRSGLIEALAAEGRLDPDALRVLNRNVTFDYPEAVSTRLYPEWPFIALANTDPALRDAVTLALLRTPQAGLDDTWGAPVSYHAARELVAAHAGPETAPAAPVSAWFATLVAVLAVGAALGAGAFGWRLGRRRAEEPAPAPGTDPDITLTRRERQILDRIEQGQSSKEIAAALGISPKTVEFHRSNLLRKFEARSAAQLVAQAQARGF